MRILIVKLSSLGDVIHTLPALFLLRKKYPDAHITWLIEEESADLVVDHPLIDNIIVFRKKRWLHGLGGYRKLAQTFHEAADFIKELRSSSYDLVIDFQGLLKSGILVGLCRGKRKRGFYPGREKSHLFLNEKVPHPGFGLHAVDRYISLISSLGCSCQSPEFSISIHQAQRDRVAAFFQEKGISAEKPIVLLHPGTRWESKLWEEKRWALLGDLLRDKNDAQVIFTGSRGDVSLISRITKQMRTPGVTAAGSLNLKELAFLQTQADVVVIPDSGPMHLAAALGRPVVALFGPTDPSRTGPYGDIHSVIFKTMECRPCFRRQCSFNKCMKEISEIEVWEATQPYLSDSDRQKIITEQEKCHGLK